LPPEPTAALGSVGLTRTERALLFTEESPLVLESGRRLAPVEVAYETYGRLDENASNAVVICHALTGDAHAAGHHGDPARPGWWDNLIGPGKAIDTDRFFVVSSNLLGGCSGTTGPSSIDPSTGRPYGLRFPLFTVSDLLKPQRALLARLGISRPFAAIGGSLGGMQVLQWAIEHPDELGAGMLVCASAQLSAQNIAFSAVGRAAIMRDENFADGDYYDTGKRPDVGLAIARMAAHITYVSEGSLEAKFGRARSGKSTLDADFEVERYLDHQGRIFLDRFDANSYLYLSRVMDFYDPFDAASRAQLATSTTKFLVLSFDSDWRFPTSHSRHIAGELEEAGVAAELREISSPHGHDSFLLPVAAYHEAIRAFLAGVQAAASAPVARSR
jgi:homoserine O-acetyltransferase/O-succinyltransferase